jgi:hypothetical protein
VVPGILGTNVLLIERNTDFCARRISDWDAMAWTTLNPTYSLLALIGIGFKKVKYLCLT